jgi:DNA invertase Pin-like site-specific DNA recombinase
MKTVVGYCRSACEPLRGPSPVRSQARELRRYAKRRGVAIRETYMDHAASGMTLDRPGLHKLIADCHAGKIGVILVTDPERLSRDTGKLIALLHVFRTTGVHVEFSTSAGRTRFAFLTVLLSAVAEVDGAAANASLGDRQASARASTPVLTKRLTMRPLA